VVSSVEIALDGGCTVFDPRQLERSGALALYPSPEGVRVVTAAQVSGHRLWHGAPPSPLRLALRGQ
jgi:hypothetical protein